MRKDRDLAIYWYTYSIKAGMTDGVHDLGVLYLEQPRGSEDRVHGYAWLLFSKQLGDDDIDDDLAHYRGQLTRAELQKAEAQAGAWVRSFGRTEARQKDIRPCLYDRTQSCT